MQFLVLHALPNAPETMSVGWPLLLFLSGALLVALAALARHVGMRSWGATVAFVLFGAAVVMTVVPVDHLAAGSEHASDGPAHALHCHDTPGSCSQLPVSSGPGQFLTADPLLAEPAMLIVLIALATLPLASTFRKPDVRPPLAAALV